MARPVGPFGHPLPTQERLRELFNYDPETGAFTRRKANKRRSRGVSPSANKGYPTINVDGKRYVMGRLIWVWMKGSIPPKMIVDHENRDSSNYQWTNLRLLTWGGNQLNTAKRGKNPHLPKHVKAVIRGRFAVAFTAGTYDTIEEATAVARKVADLLFESKITSVHSLTGEAH